jgi:hypothetical protein
LDLRLVQYLVMVAEELHFFRAAAQLHIAQPSLGHEIRITTGTARRGQETSPPFATSDPEGQ